MSDTLRSDDEPIDFEKWFNGLQRRLVLEGVLSKVTIMVEDETDTPIIVGE